jgi:hypothetical protein
MLVSSAKNVGIPRPMPASRSFICSKNNTGPRTEPCGTPWLMGLFRDRQLMILFFFFASECNFYCLFRFLDTFGTILVSPLVFPFLSSFLAIYHYRLSRMLLIDPKITLYLFLSHPMIYKPFL